MVSSVVRSSVFPRSGLLLLSMALLLSACGGDDDGFPTAETFVPPEASDLGVSPGPVVATLLTAAYQFSDQQSRPEGDSLIEWFVDGALVGQGHEYTSKLSHEGLPLFFCVTPKAAYGSNDTGVRVCSVEQMLQPKPGQAPVASEVAIALPLQPGSNAKASYQYADADGDLEGASQTQWRIDGDAVGTGLTLLLPPDSEGKNLQFCVTPVAKTGEPKQGLTVCDTQRILGSYLPPVANNVRISPTPMVGSALTGSYSYADMALRPEGASLQRWVLAGADIAFGLGYTPTTDAEGKLLRFCVTPVAAWGVNSVGAEVCSAPLAIAPKPGSAPTATSVAIATPLQPGQATFASYVYGDADGDAEGASQTLWRVDGVEVGVGLSLTLPADSEGKSLQFCVTAVALTGEPKQGAEVCVTENIIGSYLPPQASNLAFSPSAVVGGSLNGSYDYSDSQSRPEGSSVLVWQIDGTDFATGSSVLLPVAQEGNDLRFCVTPVAAWGENDTGVQACSAPETIAPKPGSAPTAANLSWDTLPKANVLLGVNYDYADADGDLEAVSLFSWKLDGTEVSQNISYTPPMGSEGQTLSFCVTPVAATGTPKVGSETCITTQLAAILLSGELRLYETLTLDVRGYSVTGVSWKSTKPGDGFIRSTDVNGFSIQRSTDTESAFNLVGYDIEVCVTTVEEGELCRLASEYPSDEVTGGLPMALDGSNNVIERAVAPIDYVDLTIGGVTKRLHRPLTVPESILLQLSLPGAPNHDGFNSESGSLVQNTLYTWPNADALCTARGMTLAVEGENDTSDPFGLRQYYDELASRYPAIPVAHAARALGWGVDVDYYWSSSDAGGGSHMDFYMAAGDAGSIDDTTPEYAACQETLP